MLLDDNDLKMIKNKNERVLFNEVLNAYYSKNYRGAIVSLYSLVIFDLYLKLNDLVDNGSKNAKQTLNEISEQIKNNAHYSDIEKKIISFFVDNYGNYFNKFSCDIEYLTNLRHKCAHLFLNDEDLFVPSPNQTKMLIESMLNNLLKVDAPFIDDLFPFIKDEIDDYASKYKFFFFLDGSDYKPMREKLTRKYYSKMTDESLIKTMNNLFRLAFVSKSEETQSRIAGIFIFLESLVHYCHKHSKLSDDNLTKIANYIHTRIDYENTSKITIASNVYYFIFLGQNYQEFMNLYQGNVELIKKIKSLILDSARNLMKFYNYFTEEELKNAFCNREILIIQDMDYYELFDFYVENRRLTIDKFFELSFNRIGNFNSFSTADVLTNMLIEKIDSLTFDDLKKILQIYNRNSQCYNRSNNDAFVSMLLQKYPDIDKTQYKNIFKD